MGEVGMTPDGAGGVEAGLLREVLAELRDQRAASKRMREEGKLALDVMRLYLRSTDYTYAPWKPSTSDPVLINGRVYERSPDGFGFRGKRSEPTQEDVLRAVLEGVRLLVERSTP